MWTRTQVARHLGKSIATVRRMEGELLHPWVDDEGVHWFDPEKVEAVRQRVSSARDHDTQSAWFQDLARGEPSAQHEADDERPRGLTVLRNRLAAAERELARAQHLLREATARERALILRHHAAREAIVDEIHRFISSLSPRQLGQQNIGRIVSLVRSLQSIDAARA